MKERIDKTIIPTLHKRMKSWRAALLLGVLGELIGPIAGLMTYIDGETLQAEITELNQAQANMSYVFDRQTLIVRAQLEEMHELSKSSKGRLIRHEGQMT